MGAKVTKLSDEDRLLVIADLKINPGRNAWAIQDLERWPDKTTLYYRTDSIGIGNLTYLLLTGHPGAQQTKTIVLNGNSDLVEPLLEFLPAGKWILRETSAAMAPVIKSILPAAHFFLEDRMQVERVSFKPAKKTIPIRMLVESDAIALAEFQGAPPQAAPKFIQWIRGAKLLGAWEGPVLTAIASTFVTTAEVCELIGIETRNGFRGKGIGTQVTSALTEIALESAPIVTLTVLSDNEPALKMYRKLGYKKCEDRIWVDNGTGSIPR